MVEVVWIIYNIYDQNLTKNLTYGDHTFAGVSHNKNIYQPISHSSIRHNFF